MHASEFDITKVGWCYKKWPCELCVNLLCKSLADFFNTSFLSLCDMILGS